MWYKQIKNCYFRYNEDLHKTDLEKLIEYSASAVSEAFLVSFTASKKQSFKVNSAFKSCDHICNS